MTRQDITELAAILVAERGYTALQIAESRRDQHRRAKNAAAYELWDAIAVEVAHRFDVSAPAEADRAERTGRG